MHIDACVDDCVSDCGTAFISNTVLRGEQIVYIVMM